MISTLYFRERLSPTLLWDSIQLQIGQRPLVVAVPSPVSFPCRVFVSVIDVQGGLQAISSLLATLLWPRTVSAGALAPARSSAPSFVYPGYPASMRAACAGGVAAAPS